MCHGNDFLQHFLGDQWLSGIEGSPEGVTMISNSHAWVGNEGSKAMLSTQHDI